MTSEETPGNKTAIDLRVRPPVACLTPARYRNRVVGTRGGRRKGVILTAS